MLDRLSKKAEALIRGGSVDISVVMLGARGAGKTSMLTAMYERFCESRMDASYNGNIVIWADAFTKARMGTYYRKLRELAESRESVEQAIPGDSVANCYRYYVSSDLKDEAPRHQLSVSFTDYPGEWLSEGNENYGQVVDYIKTANVLLVAVDAPYLMEEEGVYHNKRNLPDVICKIVREAWGDNMHTRRMVLFVPIKCEKYHALKDGKKRVLDEVRRGYGSLIKELQRQKYCGVFFIKIEKV